jgi:hypothetical protein
MLPRRTNTLSSYTKIRNHRRVKTRLLALTLILAGSTFAGAHSQAFLSLATSDTGYNNNSAVPLTFSISDNETLSGVNYLTEASGTSGYGLMRAYARSQYSGPASATSFSASADALSGDELTIDAPGLTGQLGTLIFSVHVSANVSTGAEDSMASVSTYVRATSDVDDQTFSRSLSIGTNDTDSFSEDGVVTINFTFGTPFDIVFHTDAIAHAARTTSAGTSDTIADFGSTLVWNGITSVQDSGAGNVTGYTATSFSGTDYTVPVVPEPASVTLLLGAAGLLGLRRRRAAI